jgi:hypothetical protein
LRDFTPEKQEVRGFTTVWPSYQKTPFSRNPVISYAFKSLQSIQLFFHMVTFSRHLVHKNHKKHALKAHAFQTLCYLTMNKTMGF